MSADTSRSLRPEDIPELVKSQPLIVVTGHPRLPCISRSRRRGWAFSSSADEIERWQVPAEMEGQQGSTVG